MANHFLIVIGWLGTVLVALVVGRFAAFDPRWDSYLVGASIAGVVCVCVYAVVWWRDHAPREPTPAAQSRLPVATLVAGVAMAAAIAMLAGSYGPRWDVTANGVYQLSRDTRDVLRRLDAPARILLFVEDADKQFQQALSAGAEVVMPLADQFWGDRYGIVKDPSGHHWSIGSHMEDLTPAQMQERMAKAFCQ